MNTFSSFCKNLLFNSGTWVLLGLFAILGMRIGFGASMFQSAGAMPWAGGASLLFGALLYCACGICIFQFFQRLIVQETDKTFLLHKSLIQASCILCAGILFLIVWERPFAVFTILPSAQFSSPLYFFCIAFFIYTLYAAGVFWKIGIAFLAKYFRRLQVLKQFNEQCEKFTPLLQIIVVICAVVLLSSIGQLAPEAGKVINPLWLADQNSLGALFIGFLTGAVFEVLFYASPVRLFIAEHNEENDREEGYEAFIFYSRIACITLGAHLFAKTLIFLWFFAKEYNLVFSWYVWFAQNVFFLGAGLLCLYVGLREWRKRLALFGSVLVLLGLALQTSFLWSYAAIPLLDGMLYSLSGQDWFLLIFFLLAPLGIYRGLWQLYKKNLVEELFDI